MSDDQDQVINPFLTPLQNPGSDKRLRILTAAEEIFSNKGYRETTISEIASQAGINDAIIYRYFKGKEDLLFSIIEDRLKEGLALLDRDLRGLNDPKSRLRKMMWGNLWYQNAFSAYSRILLFECRSSTRFYSSPAFQLVQKYIDHLTAILELGIKEGCFRRDLAIPIMRDMVLGTLDMITICFHELDEVENSMFDFEDAAVLMESLLVPKQEMERNLPDKSSMILESAEKVFAKKGFDRTKMSEIARMAGVGDGTVYEYFENKEVLLFSIPKRRFEQYRNELTGVFHPDSVVDKLKKLIRFHFTTLMAEPHFLRIYAINLFLNKGFYHSVAFESFRGYFRLLEEVLEEGKKKGVFLPEVNPRIYRNMVLGTFCHMATRWLGDRKMSEVSRMKEVNQVVDLMADSILA